MPGNQLSRLKWLKLNRTAKLVMATGLLFTLAIGTLYVSKPKFYTSAEQKIYDTLLHQAHRSETTGVPVVVEIDQRSLDLYGPWPWPRNRLALLLTEIEELGARTIGLDMVLTGKDQSSPEAIRKQWQRDFGLAVELTGLPDPYHDSDQSLARVIARDIHIMGYRFTYDPVVENSACRLHPLTVIPSDDNAWQAHTKKLRKATGAVCNLALFAEKASGSGFLDAFSDHDGVIRKMPVVIAHGDRIYPSFALSLVMHHMGYAEGALENKSDGSARIVFANHAIPLDPQGHVLVHYRGSKKTFTYISAADVLGGKLAPDTLNNKIVLVGPSVSDVNPRVATPMDETFPNVELQATLVDNILADDYIVQPQFVVALELAFLVGFGLLSTFLLSQTNSKLSLAVLGICSLGIWGGSHLILSSKGIILSPMAPLLAIAGNFWLLILLKYAHEERRVKQTHIELSHTQAAAIRGLATLAETRDPETGGHILRTQRYVRVLAEQLYEDPRFRDQLDTETIDQFYNMAPLHDIGKVGIPDNVLLKPGPLTAEEFRIMKKHTDYGRRALEKAQEVMVENRFFKHAIDIAYCHQEKWDGSGYPRGIKGTEIPLSARLMAVADVYDALISKRVYKPPFPHEKAVQIILAGRGSHFDPDLVAAFETCQGRFRRIAYEFADYEEERQTLK